MAGYFYRALDYDKNKQPCPILIFIGGFDSTAEELYFCGAAAAIKFRYLLWNTKNFIVGIIGDNEKSFDAFIIKQIFVLYSLYIIE